jgi:hypothetical protein
LILQTIMMEFWLGFESGIIYTLVWIYADQLKCKIGSLVNQLVDYYLEYSIQIKPEEMIIKKHRYQLDKIVSDTRQQVFESAFDLHQNKYLLRLSEWNAQQDSASIKVYFTYQDQQYIVPFELGTQDEIEFPIYSPDDLATCSSSLVTLVDGTEQEQQLLTQYAGPKGNFYADVQPFIKVYPKNIRPESTEPMVLENLLGFRQIFTPDEPIILELL